MYVYYTPTHWQRRGKDSYFSGFDTTDEQGRKGAMKTVKAWAIVNVDGTYKNYYGTNHPVLYDIRDEASVDKWGKQKVVRVEIRALTPKKR